jgi:hypothetical protein
MTDEKVWVHTRDPLAALMYDLIRDFIPRQTIKDLVKTNYRSNLDGYQLEERPDGLATFAVRMANLIHQQAEDVAKNFDIKTKSVEHQLVGVLYPDGPRNCTRQQIMEWSADSWYNDADWYRCPLHDCNVSNCEDNGYDCSNLEPIYNGSMSKPTTLEEAIHLLEDRGEMTFAKEPFSDTQVREGRQKREAED